MKIPLLELTIIRSNGSSSENLVKPFYAFI